MYRLSWMVGLLVMLFVVAGCGPKKIAVSSGEKVICSECGKVIRSNIKTLKVSENEVTQYSVRKKREICSDCQAKIEAKKRAEEERRRREEARLAREKERQRAIEAERIRTSFYQDATDERIKAELRRKWQKGAAAPKTILTEHDLGKIRNYDADRRPVMLLAHFCADGNHRFAGRINDGYADNAHMTSRETYYGPGEAANWSAHYTAQALDIFYADGVEIAWQVGSDPVKQARAQAKIREIMAAIFALARKNRSLLPTQVMVYSQSDVNYFASDIRSFYGSYSGNMGMWANERMWDRIHIGY